MSKYLINGVSLKRELKQGFQMKKREDTTIAINGERKKALQEAAVEVTIATREPVKPASIVQYLIDNYLKEAIKDLKARRL